MWGGDVGTVPVMVGVWCEYVCVTNTVVCMCVTVYVCDCVCACTHAYVCVIVNNENCVYVCMYDHLQ